MQKLSERIKKLQESELTLEEMESEDTNFVLEEKYVISVACMRIMYIMSQKNCALLFNRLQHSYIQAHC